MSLVTPKLFPSTVASVYAITKTTVIEVADSSISEHDIIIRLEYGEGCISKHY